MSLTSYGIPYRSMVSHTVAPYGILGLSRPPVFKSSTPWIYLRVQVYLVIYDSG